jgi:ketol-acid reductoisomerase
MNKLTKFTKPLLFNKRFINYNTHQINYGNCTEDIYSLQESNLKTITKNKNISIIGYGPQGRSQSLNLKDNGFKVNIGVRKGASWNKALKDGWIENKNLFSIEESAKRGDIIKYLLSDAGQIENWEYLFPYLTENKTLYFSHGFGIVYPEITKIIPPKNIDVILVAPKGPGIKLRESFINKKGINSSFAVYQDYSGNARNKAMEIGFGIGSKYLFETTFKNEVYSDLTGERCVLMGLIQGAFKAQYDVLIENGHSPSEAYNETVEEALESLFPLIHDNGMDWMFENCSTTAQRGALDWAPKFEKVIKPVIRECYEEVKNGNEIKKVVTINSNPNYRYELKKELKSISNSSLWNTRRLIKKID